jgi:hypothetical protein
MAGVRPVATPNDPMVTTMSFAFVQKTDAKRNAQWRLQSWRDATRSTDQLPFWAKRLNLSAVAR